MSDDDNNIKFEIQKLLQKRIEDYDDVVLLGILKYLRNCCANGPTYQNILATHHELNGFLHSLLFSKAHSISSKIHLMAWQLLANVIVNNPQTQKEIFNRHGDAITQHCVVPPLDKSTDIKLMILYNVYQGGMNLFPEEQAFIIIVQVWKLILEERCDLSFDYLHFFFENFLVEKGRKTVRYYSHLNIQERIAFLNYVVNYLGNDSPNGTVNNFLLQYFSKEFKLKSDCILCGSTLVKMEPLYPREVYALLSVISSASGCESYSTIYVTDHALFLNASSLLRCLVAAGRESTPNIFTPMSKLEQVALTSNLQSDFESEVSFELKTMLVRCIANLLYKNKKNQEYCIDTQLMPTLFECTTMDARNPLIKEWSLFAIRNASVNCPEAQNIIRNLTQQGSASNDIISELNLQMGSLRIKPNVE